MARSSSWWELLLPAMLLAITTYAAGFNPPGGVWQDTDIAAGHLPGDPILRDTSYPRYLAFFYCNATAFALSLVAIILIHILSVLDDRGMYSLAALYTLRVVMVMDLLSVMGAYTAGTCRDTLTTVCSLLLVAGVVVYIPVNLAMALRSLRIETETETETEYTSRLERLRNMLMLFAMFAVSVTYLAGLSAPGGFRNSDSGGHRPGHVVLKGVPHDARLKAFLVCNTTAFVASLLIIVRLLNKELRWSKVRSCELYVFIFMALVGLVGAYSAGSSREIGTTIYASALIGVILMCILIKDHIVPPACFMLEELLEEYIYRCFSRPFCCGGASETSSGNNRDNQRQTEALRQARPVVLLLATLAAAITYQAGLHPPGGLWADDGDGYMAGDPILLTRNPKRYKAFFYCNSVAFVASLVAIVVVQKSRNTTLLEAVTILDLFCLIGAYAAGSCRAVHMSIYAMALAGAALVYVVIHVVFFTRDHKVNNAIRGSDVAALKKLKDGARLVEKRRQRLLLFAILASSITYQAGLSPPSSFWLEDDKLEHHAGDQVVHYNSLSRYKAFFYCNSVSFMLSIALIILLVNKNYRPSIRSNALSVYTAVGMCSLVGAYAAGSTQHFITSFYIFVLSGVVMLVLAVLVVLFLFVQPNAEEDEERNANTTVEEEDKGTTDEEEEEEEEEEVERIDTVMEDINITRAHFSFFSRRRRYLMLSGILLASVTYKSGLEPPGGVWQSDVGHHNRRQRYLAFFYSNSTSFVASIVIIILLLPLDMVRSRLKVIDTTLVLDLLGILVAYAAGTSRSWKTTGYDLVLVSVLVSALVIAMLGYYVIHFVVSSFRRIYQRLAELSARQSKAERRRWRM